MKLEILPKGSSVRSQVTAKVIKLFRRTEAKRIDKTLPRLMPLHFPCAEIPVEDHWELDFRLPACSDLRPGRSLALTS